MKKISICLLVLVLSVSSLAGCQKINRDTKIVLTTGFTKDEVFRIENQSCYLKEMMVYLTNIQNQYEQVYGAEIWNVKTGGTSLESRLKESVLAQLAQIKTMNLMANNYGLTLSEEESELVKNAAKQYYDSLSAREIELLDVNIDTIIEMYSEYALADQVYKYLIKDINPEISDDEARTITVEQILFRTRSRDVGGNSKEYTESQKDDARKRAYQVKELADSGEEFELLVSLYNEALSSSISFGKGEMDPEYETVAFNLGEGEISDVFQTSDGYLVIKCVSTLDKSQTDENKVRIVEQRKKEAFNKEYDAFVETLTRNMNDELWSGVEFLHDEDVDTADFFDTYDQVVSKGK